MKNIRQRFEDKIFPEPMSGCWLWMGTINGKGYGHFRMDGKTRTAHRVSYELFKAPIPDDLSVLHKCDNTICANPSHLFLGTQQDNVDDMMEKGRCSPAVGEANGSSKVTTPDVREIYAARKSGQIIRHIADRFNVSVTCVQNICSGRTWSHVTGVEKI